MLTLSTSTGFEPQIFLAGLSSSRNDVVTLFIKHTYIQHLFGICLRAFEMPIALKKQEEIDVRIKCTPADQSKSCMEFVSNITYTVINRIS